MLALLAVLALVIGLGWLLKRMPGSGFRPAEGMKLVASLSVGAKERVVVVEVNGQQLLLGVTAGGINTLPSRTAAAASTGARAGLQEPAEFRPAAAAAAAQIPDMRVTRTRLATLMPWLLLLALCLLPALALAAPGARPPLCRTSTSARSAASRSACRCRPCC